MTIRGPLALLITSLAIAGEPIAPQKADVSYPSYFSDFFLSAVVTPLTTDLAAAARELDGIGCAFYSYAGLLSSADVTFARRTCIRSI